MNLYVLLGSFVAFVVYIPLIIKVWRKTLVQNLATYALWGLLDFIAAGSIILKHGNFLLPAMYSAVSFGVMLGVLRTKTVSWGYLENLTSLLVIASIVVWAFVGDREATIISSISVAIAGVPQLVDFWKKPHESPLAEYVGFTIANGLSLIGGANWSVAERFYPVVCTATTTVFVLVILARRRQQLT